MDFRPRQESERDLGGRWRAHPLGLELKRTGADADLDDSHWQELQVPGHWGQGPELADHGGPILYRRRFRHRPAEADERLWLRFDGVLSGAEVWLDGHYIGDTSSYFAPHRFDITPYLSAGTDDSDSNGSDSNVSDSNVSDNDEHLLAVEVSCPDVGNESAKTSLTGSLQAGHLAPVGNPGGIWRDVAIDSTGPVAILHSRLICSKATSERAELQIRLVLHARHQCEVRIDTSIVGPDGASAGGGGDHHTLASGENRIEWTAEIDDPRLWWPAALGPQPLYDVAVAVRLDDSQLSDRRDWRTGLRQVEVDNFIWRINGQRLFVKGIALGPSDRFLNQTAPEVLAEDMRTVREAGLDMVRIYGHVGRDELYREADRLGILVWQDLPMVGGYSSKVRSAAKAMARAMVDQLGHHPSVALWCGHSEPGGQTISGPPAPTAAAGAGSAEDESAESGGQRSPAFGVGRRFLRTRMPGWNRSILDPVVARELRNADRSRPIVARSGDLPTMTDPGGSDSHLWLGWHGGRAEDLPRILRWWPRLGTFLGGIGSQSASNDYQQQHTDHQHSDHQHSDHQHGDQNQDDRLWAGAERGALARYVPRQAYIDPRAWAAATQAYQADIVRIHIETLRRLKYSPVGGFCIEALFDVDRLGGFGVLDAARRPKTAHDVLIDACRPVVVMSDIPPPLVVPGQTVSLAVHAVSDRRQPLGLVTVTATAHHDGGEDDWRQKTSWQGDLPADSCLKIGDFSFTAPEGTGPVVIDLALESTELLATNRYRTVIIPASEAMGASSRRS